MKSDDGSTDSSAEEPNAEPPSSLSGNSCQPARLSAWKEIPSETSIPGASFQDKGRMTFWLPLIHSEKLNPKSVKKQSFVVRNLGLRHGITHLPLKLNNFCYGSHPRRTRRISSGLRKFRAFLLTAISKCNVWGFGRLTLRGFRQLGRGMTAILKQFSGGR